MNDKAKKYIKLVFTSFVLSSLILSTQSCRTGYGCKTSEQYQVKTDKRGNLSSKKGKTALFDKKTMKKIKSNRTKK